MHKKPCACRVRQDQCFASKVHQHFVVCSCACGDDLLPSGAVVGGEPQGDIGIHCRDGNAGAGIGIGIRVATCQRAEQLTRWPSGDGGIFGDAGERDRCRIAKAGRAVDGQGLADDGLQTNKGVKLFGV